jgi:hypothetical protein
LAGAIDDSMRESAQRKHGARQKRRGLRQTAKASGNPSAMTLREVLGVSNRAARRHGQDRFAVAWMNAKRVSACPPVSSQSNGVNLRAVFDQKARGFVRPPIKEGAFGHVRNSGD